MKTTGYCHSSHFSHFIQYHLLQPLHSVSGKMGYEYINVTSCLATGIALTAATVLAVIARLAVAAQKAVKSRDARFSKHLDDLFCLLALLPTIGVSTVMIYGMIQSKCSQAFP
jgi:hypothetical protein